MTLAECIGEYVAIAWWREYDRRRGVVESPYLAGTERRPVEVGLYDSVEHQLQATPTIRWTPAMVSDRFHIDRTHANVVLGRLARAKRIARLDKGIYGART